jgi:hypothetical protein
MSADPLDHDDQVGRNQELLRELAWSLALLGGVIAYLFLISQFAP